MISEIIEKWIKGILIDGITGNLSGLFDNVNAKVGEIASDVGSTPQAWNSGIFNIDKLDKELEKAREKAAEWQAKIRELEKQKQEEENSQIVQAVRSLKLTPAQLMAFLNDPKNSLTASGHTDPKPKAPEKEDTAHEEN